MREDTKYLSLAYPVYNLHSSDFEQTYCLINFIFFTFNYSLYGILHVNRHVDDDVCMISCGRQM